MNRTRGHQFKLNVQYSRMNCRKFYFANRVVPICNSLPVNVVETQSILQFKRYLTNVNLDIYCKGRALNVHELDILLFFNDKYY